jgi:hypothetical protein
VSVKLEREGGREARRVESVWIVEVGAAVLEREERRAVDASYETERLVSYLVYLARVRWYIVLLSFAERPRRLWVVSDGRVLQRRSQAVSSPI